MSATDQFEDAEQARDNTTSPVADAVAPLNIPGEVCKVGVRIPPFWPDEPEIWFAQVEGQFTMNGITKDLTKFNYVIGSLDRQYAKEVKDLIIEPPSTDKYEKLKSELIKRLSDSHENKVKQLLKYEELGDRKPSQFWRHLLSLAGPTVPLDFLKTIWLSRLPNHIQTVLATQPSASLEVLADLADRIQGIACLPQQVTAVSQPTSSKDSEIAKEVAELRRMVQSLMSRDSGRSRSPSRRGPIRSRSQSASKRSTSSYRKFPTCWYHSRFGENAQRCVKPCDYKAENSGGSR